MVQKPEQFSEVEIVVHYLVQSYLVLLEYYTRKLKKKHRTRYERHVWITLTLLR